jgi:hypothetical protein
VQQRTRDQTRQATLVPPPSLHPQQWVEQGNQTLNAYTVCRQARSPQNPCHFVLLYVWLPFTNITTCTEPISATLAKARQLRIVQLRNANPIITATISPGHHLKTAGHHTLKGRAFAHQLRTMVLRPRLCPANHIRRTLDM